MLNKIELTILLQPFLYQTDYLLLFFRNFSYNLKHVTKPLTNWMAYGSSKPWKISPATGDNLLNKPYNLKILQTLKLQYVFYLNKGT